MRVVLIVVMLFTGTCIQAEPLPLRNIPRVEAQSARVLTDWLILGPWSAEASNTEPFGDFLQKDRGRETVQTPPALKGLLREKGRWVSGQEWIDLSEVFKLFPSQTTEEIAGYAQCMLHSAEPHEAWLLFGSDAQIVVWLNGERVHTSCAARNLRAYDDAVRLRLRRGDNALLIKAVSQEGCWRFCARLEPDLDAAVRTILALNYKFFKQSLVAPGQALELYTRGMPAAAQFEGDIIRFDGIRIRTATIAPDVPLSTEALPDGLYRFVRKGSESEAWCAPVFYVGTYAGLYESMRERVAGLDREVEDRTRITMHGYLRRLEVLRDVVQAAFEESGSGEWAGQPLVYESEHKAVYAATALEAILRDVVRREEPFRHKVGLHLRGFRSGMDGAAMYYRLFVPSSYRGDEAAGVPLFILPATPFESGRPFLESVFVANQREAEEWGRVAERLGVILLWPGYRVSPYGNPIDFAHFEEVLAAVRADYRVDRTRLYLEGYCGSAIFSAMEVLRHPKRYAAVVMVNPVLHRLKGRGDAKPEYSESAEYRAWLRDTDPLLHCAPLAQIPIQILHDGVDPDHGPLAHSVELVNALRTEGGSIELLRRGYAPKAVRDQWVLGQLAWACAQRREDASEEIGVSTDSLSVADVLSEPFIIVRGTCGDEAQHVAAAQWTAAFRESWKRTCFADCRVVDDVALTEEDGCRYNLVLIGSPMSNAVWRRLEHSLPVKVECERIEIPDKVYCGQSLSIQAAFANPEKPSRKILLLGSAAPRATFGTLELAIEGWFRWAIWETEFAARRGCGGGGEGMHGATLRAVNRD